MDVSSRVALALGQRQLAADLSERAVHLDGEDFGYLAQRATCLLALQRYADADALMEVLAARASRTAAEEDALGNLFSLRGDQVRAMACFQRATDSDPGRAHHWLNLALCQQGLGKLEAAERAFDRCIALDPGEKDAWLHRSRLRNQSQERNHVEELQSAISGCGGDWRREMTLCYALAKELEDLGEHARSFAELQRGASLRRSHMNHDAGADTEVMAEVRRTFGVEYLQRSTQASDSEEPIFIIGLPRTGTTLVERILGSHSEVFAAGELNNFAESLTALVAPMKPRDRLEFVRLSAQADSGELGKKYLESVRPLTGPGSRFVDKLPLNFLYCGLIHRALPRAKIIHLRREPMDACFAIYKTLFKQAYPFSYDLVELGNYYLAYRELMAHWHQVMPGVILDIEYEVLVSDPEVQTRRLLDYCDLPWEDACLNFHRNAAPSMTASLAQVRQPVYTSSVGRWRFYEKELASLAALLRHGGLTVGSEPAGDAART
jgi:tetratricopeptide (TPR) repeat protein